MKAHPKLKKSVAGFLILAMLHLCWVSSFAWAEMVATTTVVPSQTETSNPRQRLIALLNREDVAGQLQQHGISQVEAVARINSLSDDEVTAVVEKIDQLPEGGYLNIPPEGYAFALIALWVGVAASISFITCSARGAVCAVANCQAKYSGWSDCTGTWFRALVLGEGFPSKALVINNDRVEENSRQEFSEPDWH